MSAKTDFSAALTAQGIQRPAMMPIVNVRQVLLTWLAVSSGFPGNLDHLEMLGIHLGPTHA